MIVFTLHVGDEVKAFLVAMMMMIEPAVMGRTIPLPQKQTQTPALSISALSSSLFYFLGSSFS